MGGRVRRHAGTMTVDSSPTASTSTTTEERSGEDDQCWICLDGDTEGRELYHPCACPRWAHAKCVARWQLQCSGKPEEVTCKFCHQELPNWRSTLFRDVVRAGSEDGGARTMGGKPGTPWTKKRSSMDEIRRPSSFDEDDEEGVRNTRDEDDGGGSGDIGEIQGDIIVKFNNISFRCQVRTGPDGLADFMRQIRERCGIPEEKMKSLNLTYRCKDPSNGLPMTLEGLNESAFDAAVLCSAVQDRMKHQARAESGAKSPRTSEITSRNKGRRSNDTNTFEDGRRDEVSAFHRY